MGHSEGFGSMVISCSVVANDCAMASAYLGQVNSGSQIASSSVLSFRIENTDNVLRVTVSYCVSSHRFLYSEARFSF